MRRQRDGEMGKAQVAGEAGEAGARWPHDLAEPNSPLRTHGPGLRTHAIIHPFSAGGRAGVRTQFELVSMRGGYLGQGAGSLAHGQLE
jgi:hypothetical protein